VEDYCPTIFDLVNISGLIAESCNSHIPSIFLDAASVDSARQIGSGASFGASIRAIPKGPETIQTQPIDLGGLSIATTSPAPTRPKKVVFKVARVAFNQQGNPRHDHRASLQSVLTEFHALLYPPLLEHPNVVNLLDIAWGTNPFNPEQRLPALVLEYADQGTLLDAINRGAISRGEKRILCHDIASGLQALHEAGLVHGDVKSENVLLFSGQARRIAKLGDFGFSIIEDVERDTIWLGGTKPWQAPEVQRAVPLSQAKHADTYSFGLLVWCLALNGLDPFKRFLIPERPAEEWDQELLDFKAQDGLRSASKVNVWFPLDFTQKMLENPSDPNVAGISRLMRGKAPGAMEALFTQACAALVAEDELLSVIDKVFENSLVSEPGLRCLPLIVEILRPVTTTRPTLEAVYQPSTSNTGETHPSGNAVHETPFSDSLRLVPTDRGSAERAEACSAPFMPDAVPRPWSQRGFKVFLVIRNFPIHQLTCCRINCFLGKTSAHYLQLSNAPYLGPSLA
jgi:serine/threonine protein kinase